MDKKLIEKAFKEDNFNLLKETYTKEELIQIPHLIISEQLNINNPVELCRWLFNNGIDYNAKDNLGNTGLMIACFMKNKEFVELYLSLDTDTNPDEGITPLMLSLEGLVNKEIVELLLEKNPDVDIITKYNKTEISAISLAYQNTNNKLFEELIKRSKNIIKHYKIIEKLPSYLLDGTKNLKNKALDIAYDDYIDSFYNTEPLKSLNQLIQKYKIDESIETIILNKKTKNIKCINKEKNEFLYNDAKVNIYFIKDNKTQELTFIDILINEEIIYPEKKKERIKKQKELNDKIKEYNNSFKIDLGYKRELDDKKIKKLIQKTNELEKLAKELDEYSELLNREEKTINKTKTIRVMSKENNNYVEPNIPGKIHFNSMQTYIFEYLDENDFRKKERSIRKYNMFAYKKLTYNYYPEIRKGNFLGKEVSRNAKNQTISYELKLPTDELFKKVHGEIILHYTVYAERGIVVLTNITPEGILDEGCRAELSTYKGVMISKTNPEKDMFKINLLNMLGK